MISMKPLRSIIFEQGASNRTQRDGTQGYGMQIHMQSMFKILQTIACFHIAPA